MQEHTTFKFVQLFFCMFQNSTPSPTVGWLWSKHPPYIQQCTTMKMDQVEYRNTTSSRSSSTYIVMFLVGQPKTALDISSVTKGMSAIVL